MTIKPLSTDNIATQNGLLFKKLDSENDRLRHQLYTDVNLSYKEKIAVIQRLEKIDETVRDILNYFISKGYQTSVYFKGQESPTPIDIDENQWTYWKNRVITTPSQIEDAGDDGSPPVALQASLQEVSVKSDALLEQQINNYLETGNLSNAIALLGQFSNADHLVTLLHRIISDMLRSNKNFLSDPEVILPLITIIQKLPEHNLFEDFFKQFKHNLPEPFYIDQPFADLVIQLANATDHLITNPYDQSIIDCHFIRQIIEKRLHLTNRLSPLKEYPITPNEYDSLFKIINQFNDPHLKYHFFDKILQMTPINYPNQEVVWYLLKQVDQYKGYDPSLGHGPDTRDTTLTSLLDRLDLIHPEPYTPDEAHLLFSKITSIHNEGRRAHYASTLFDRILHTNLHLVPNKAGFILFILSHPHPEQHLLMRALNFLHKTEGSYTEEEIDTIMKLISHLPLQEQFIQATHVIQSIQEHHITLSEPAEALLSNWYSKFLAIDD